MLATITKITIQILAGMGVMNLLDSFVKPKVGPTYYPETISPGFKIPKLLWFVGAFIAAFMLLKFIGRKMKISLLK